MSKRRSPIWKYFTTRSEQDRIACCAVCNSEVSRGGSSVKTFTATNLDAHLRKHPSEYKQYQDKESTTASVSEQDSQAKQLTMEEVDSRTRIWDINDPRAARISRRIGEMIAVDSQRLMTQDLYVLFKLLSPGTLFLVVSTLQIKYYLKFMLVSLQKSRMSSKKLTG